MLEQVIASFKEVQYLDECTLVIVCDGHREANGNVWKAGKVNAEGAANYALYLKNLEALVLEGKLGPSTLLVILEGRHGQALAVKAGLDYVKTPYVLVHQHDLLFMVDFELRSVLTALESTENDVKYVGMPLLTNIHYEQITFSRHRVKITPIVLEVEVNGGSGGSGGNGGSSGDFAEDMGKVSIGCTNSASSAKLVLMPIIFWYDSTHVTSVSHYRSLVFNQSNPFRRGDFVEETFGHKQRHHITQASQATPRGNSHVVEVQPAEERWESVHQQYGTYHVVCTDRDGSRVPAICHMNGNRYLTDGQRAAKYLKGRMPNASVAKLNPSRVMKVRSCIPPLIAQLQISLLLASAHQGAKVKDNTQHDPDLCGS
jgi:hypothetical protein